MSRPRNLEVLTFTVYVHFIYYNSPSLIPIAA